MKLFMGIDPGAKGAFVVGDGNTIYKIWRMPVYTEMAGKRKRQRVDAAGVATIAEQAALMGVTLAVAEHVGGRSGEGAAGMFMFGYGTGLFMMALMYNNIPVETIAPSTWKKIMNVPGKSKADATAIVNKADQLFPENTKDFRGPRGGLIVDVAEAAMLHRFGALHLDGRTGELGDVEARMIYNPRR